MEFICRQNYVHFGSKDCSQEMDENCLPIKGIQNSYKRHDYFMNTTCLFIGNEILLIPVNHSLTHM